MYHLKNAYHSGSTTYSERLSVTMSYDLNVPKQLINIPIRLDQFAYNSNAFNDDFMFQANLSVQGRYDGVYPE